MELQEEDDSQVLPKVSFFQSRAGCFHFKSLLYVLCKPCAHIVVVYSHTVRAQLLTAHGNPLFCHLYYQPQTMEVFLANFKKKFLSNYEIYPNKV